MTRRQTAGPSRGSITRLDGTEVTLRFEPIPGVPNDFRALDAATGEPVVFHPGDEVHIDRLNPGQSVLIADRVTEGADA